jgi:predicted small lipoprotein YifL
MLRLLTTLFVALSLLAPLSACGKRGKLDAPEGSTYPRQYPPAR